MPFQCLEIMTVRYQGEMKRGSWPTREYTAGARRASNGALVRCSCFRACQSRALNSLELRVELGGAGKPGDALRHVERELRGENVLDGDADRLEYGRGRARDRFRAREDLARLCVDAGQGQ